LSQADSGKRCGDRRKRRFGAWRDRLFFCATRGTGGLQTGGWESRTTRRAAVAEYRAEAGALSRGPTAVHGAALPRAVVQDGTGYKIGYTVDRREHMQTRRPVTRARKLRRNPRSAAPAEVGMMRHQGKNRPMLADGVDRQRLGGLVKRDDCGRAPLLGVLVGREGTARALAPARGGRPARASGPLHRRGTTLFHNAKAGPRRSQTADRSAGR